MEKNKTKRKIDLNEYQNWYWHPVSRQWKWHKLRPINHKMQTSQTGDFQEVKSTPEECARDMQRVFCKGRYHSYLRR